MRSLSQEGDFLFTIAICDDSPEDLAKTASMLHAYFDNRGMSARINEFPHADSLLSACEKTIFDLLLLDILMPLTSGIDAGKELRSKQYAAPVIYLTSSTEYAIDAFALDAVHYLVKPFSAKAFEDAMDRALARMEKSKTQLLPIKGRGGAVRQVSIDDILYIENHDHEQIIHLQSGNLMEARHSLARLQEELNRIAPTRFISPYKGFVINMSAVSTIESCGVTLLDNTLIPISRGALKQLRSLYLEYCFRKDKS